LGQIRSKQLTNILVVVVRYFGGTLLGVSGLIKAYRSATADALEEAKIIRMKVCNKWQLKFGYPQMNEVMKVIKENELETENQQFDLECKLTVSLWKKMEERLVERFRRIENCQVENLEP